MNFIVNTLPTPIVLLSVNLAPLISRSQPGQRQPKTGSPIAAFRRHIALEEAVENFIMIALVNPDSSVRNIDCRRSSVVYVRFQ